MRMENHLCAVSCGPTHRFRIAPALMADHDAKFQRTNLENAPAGAVRISAFLRGIDLNFVLKSGDGSVWIDDQCSRQQRAIDDPLRAKNDSDLRLCGHRCNRGPRALEECRVWRRRHFTQPSVAGNKTLRK